MPEKFWEAFGAIGQWASAAATVYAVIIALNAEKPKVKFKIIEIPSDYPNTPGMDAPKIGIIFYNERNFTIKIKKAYFITKENKQQINYTFQSNFPIEIGTWDVLVSPYTLSEKIEKLGLNGKIELSFVLTDSSGREYKIAFYFDTVEKRVIKKEWHKKIQDKIRHLI